LIRIGELSRRTGVSADALRAWERRYALLDPGRSRGGFRLYSEEDERRVRAMRALIEEGLSAAEAAKLARAEAPRAAGGPSLEPRVATARLIDAIALVDEGAANSVLDEQLASLTFDAVAAGLLLPALREVGQRWRDGRLSVAQEHFATNLIRGRLLGLSRGWGAGSGPRAVLACVPGELHDIGLIIFGLCLRGRGWRITYLGPDTPPASVAAVAAEVEADLVVLVALDGALVGRSRDPLRELAGAQRLLLAGDGVEPDAAASLGARKLAGDPVEAAAAVAAAG
jgi:DNA-binding transcriptional MerR regulator/methylmalonyl-CoA mutase cobalamin-binding subunit